MRRKRRLAQGVGVEATEERGHALRFAALEIAELSATEEGICERDAAGIGAALPLARL